MTDEAQENDKKDNASKSVGKISELKALLSSKEVKDSVISILAISADLYGHSPKAKKTQAMLNILLMVFAFGCVGTLAFLRLVPDGTTGVLAGIIIGYFFKKND